MRYSVRLLVVIGLELLLIGYGPGEAKPTLTGLIHSGNAEAQAEKYETAIRDFKQAWKLYNSSDAAYNLAVIYHHELEFWDKAVHYYEKFLALEPAAAEAPQVKEWLAVARQEISPTPDGQVAAQAGLSPLLSKIMPPEGDELCRQGNEYLAQEKYEEAIGAYRKALLVNQSKAAGYNLALLYDYGLNYQANAIYYYQRFLGMAADSPRAAEAATRLEQLKQELLQAQGTGFKPKAYKLRSIK